jgi:hypothetical protein
VRQGASWTAADHRQLTVAAGPDPSIAAWVPSASLRLSGPGDCPPRRRFARRSVQPFPSGRASSPCSTRPAGTPRRRSPLSSRRCLPIRSRRPGSGCPAVRCPDTWAGRPEVRRSAVCCPPVQRPAVCCPPVGVQPSGVCPCPSGRVRLLPCSGGGVGDQAELAGRPGRATLTTRTGGGPVAAGPSTARRRSRRPGRGRRCRRRVGRWEVGGGPGPPGWVRAAAAALVAERPGRPGRRPERPSQAAARWARVQAAARGGCTGRVAGVLGLGARPRWVVVAGPDARVGGPGGARGGAGGDGRAAPARPRLTASVPGSRLAAL